jgi:DNA primase
MYIPETKISDILNSSDIVEVISETVLLKKTGSNYFGLCPFHSEKTPSFSVNPNRQIFHCFGCSTGGSVFSFLMKYHNISFPEAVKMLARKYNIEIEDTLASPLQKKKRELKETLFQLNLMVMELYNKLLKNSEYAGSYLKNRGISDEIIEEFQLGYSPASWETVASFLKKKGVSSREMLQSGLVLERKQGSGCYDRFRNRIMFPIFDVNMQVAGFGGRMMDDAMPKYMNSPETTVYVKSRILYGLHKVKHICRQKGSVYIVEGYFDFLSLYQHGIKNCVATLGTALTADHIRMLKGYAPKMTLVFDSDVAGLNAAKRSIKLFFQEGVDIRILILPDGYDPDSFVMAKKKGAFIQLASNAMTVMQFLLKVLIDTHGFSIEGRVKVLEEIKSYLLLIQDSALRSLHIKDIAERLQIDEQAVLGKIKEQYLNNPGATRIIDKKIDKTDEIALESDRREEQIIALMFHCPQIISLIKDKGVINYFYSEKLKNLATKILAAAHDDHSFMVKFIAKPENDEDQSMLASIAMKYFFSDQDIQEKALTLIDRIIRVRVKKDRHLTRKILNAGNVCDDDMMALIQKRQKEIEQLYR